MEKGICISDLYAISHYEIKGVVVPPGGFNKGNNRYYFNKSLD